MKSTVEHIIPQDPKNWIEEVHTWGWMKDNFMKWHEVHVDRFANLLSIVDYENSQLQNTPWSEKRKYYKRDAKYKRAIELAEKYEKFDVQAYGEREKVLIQWAKNRWVFPG